MVTKEFKNQKNEKNSFIVIGIYSVRNIVVMQLTAETGKVILDKPESSTVEVKAKALEPDDSFYRAEVAYIDHDFEKSSMEILHGVGFMEKLLPFAHGDQKKELEKSVSELTEFASYVKADKIDGYKDFEYFFSRAVRALSSHHLHVFETIAGEGNNNKEAARNLLKAIYYLRYSYVKSPQGLTREEQESLQKYKEFAKKIIRDEDVKDVRKVFDDAFKNINGQILIMGES